MICAIKPITRSLFIKTNNEPKTMGILSNKTHSCISIHTENIISPDIWFSSFFCHQLNTETKDFLLEFVQSVEEHPENKILIVQVGTGLSKAVALCKFLLTLFNKQDRILEKINFHDRELFKWLINHT